MSGHKKKLIEVALPLEAINRESAREKSIRHGHPSTLHLWWARRPLAACRAVLFAQLVDDPSAHPNRFPTEEDQARERQRLFDIIERLVVWENMNDEGLLQEAQEEILRSTDGVPPAIHDPFAGGGSIPLEAQRLGLEARASDLNPVAVLINKALIEIPPKFQGLPPTFPGAAEQRTHWPSSTGLGEDIRRYGRWMKEQAERRIGHLYPPVDLPDGQNATAVAWLWARTVPCPNPACAIRTPLASTWWLNKKKGRECWLEPVVEGEEVGFRVRRGSGGPAAPPKVGKGATFRCVSCGSNLDRDYVHDAFRAGRDGTTLLCQVAATGSGREYAEANQAALLAARVPPPETGPDQECRGTFGGNAQGRRYGFDTFADYYTDRQLTALLEFVRLIGEVREKVTLDRGEGTSERADAVATYLAFAVSRSADYWSSLVTWSSTGEFLRNTFARQAIPMTWDFAECNPLGSTTGNWAGAVEWVARAVESLPASGSGIAWQEDATRVRMAPGTVVCTDPPYYDNITYSDLADFFYVWLRMSTQGIYPQLMSTVLSPKEDEMVANAYRFAGDKGAAAKHFEDGFGRAFHAFAESHSPDFPLTIFYAFKQAEESEDGTASTGWETMLAGLIEAGFSVEATWPMRTEREGRSVSHGANTLASSVVLACRPRKVDAEATSRRGLISVLQAELPPALRTLQQGEIAPVDLAQAAIGPGMSVFSRYARVVEADGSEMTVRTALALINQVVDETLADQESDFDADTRFCVKWFSQFGWNEGASGEADVLARATNAAVPNLERGGVFRAAAGKARLLGPDEMSQDWDPSTDSRVSIWEVALRLAHAVSHAGVREAGALQLAASSRVDLGAVKELAYLMYAICEKKGWTESAILFNGLATSWRDLSESSSDRRPQLEQVELELEDL